MIKDPKVMNPLHPETHSLKENRGENWGREREREREMERENGD